MRRLPWSIKHFRSSSGDGEGCRCRGGPNNGVRNRAVELAQQHDFGAHVQRKQATGDHTAVLPERRDLSIRFGRFCTGSQTAGKGEVSLRKKPTRSPGDWGPTRWLMAQHKQPLGLPGSRGQQANKRCSVPVPDYASGGDEKCVPAPCFRRCRGLAGKPCCVDGRQSRPSAHRRRRGRREQRPWRPRSATSAMSWRGWGRNGCIAMNTRLRAIQVGECRARERVRRGPRTITQGRRGPPRRRTSCS